MWALRCESRLCDRLSRMQMDGSVDVEDLSDLDDEEAIAALSGVPGVGRWTAQTFLIHQLHRPDVLPAGDGAIRRAIRAGWSLKSLPTVARVKDMGARWAPDRSYAAALLWRSLYPPREPSDPKARALAQLATRRGTSSMPSGSLTSGRPPDVATIGHGASPAYSSATETTRSAMSQTAYGTVSSTIGSRGETVSRSRHG